MTIRSVVPLAANDPTVLARLVLAMPSDNREMLAELAELAASSPASTPNDPELAGQVAAFDP